MVSLFLKIFYIPILYKMSLENTYNSLKSNISAIEMDLKRFNNKKVKASGNRVRNNLLNIKKLCDELRKQILDETLKIPVRKRRKKVEVLETIKEEVNEEKE